MQVRVLEHTGKYTLPEEKHRHIYMSHETLLDYSPNFLQIATASPRVSTLSGVSLPSDGINPSAQAART